MFISYADKDDYTEAELTDDDFKFIKDGTDYFRIAKDDNSVSMLNRYALLNSVKGVKVGTFDGDTTASYDCTIAHLAKLTIRSYDDSIHTNYGNVNINSSNLSIYTWDDGIHADYNVNIKNASITINRSYEGIEGGTITIDGENTNIVLVSEDDGINAAGSLVSNKNIYLKNGFLRVYASGDGIDANTSIYFEGGQIIVEGPGRDNGSIDSDRGAYFKGGIVFACSTSGMVETMTATQNTFVYQGSNFSSDTTIDILDPNGTSLFQYKLKQSCNQIIFSHPSITIGSTYTIKAGTATATTIKQTSSLTKVGTSGGGGGQPPGGGGGWH